MSTPGPAADPGPAPRPPRGPDLGTVLGGLVLVAVGAAVGGHVLFGLSWDWKVWAAGVLLVAGFGALLATAVAAVRRPCDERDEGAARR
ncbi:hypothetical protein AB2L28_18020 [Kineococcus sp. TBRC 1896]|uniref:Uncharacterized protein n=1 Tax=Kineococcus mangrovi TaxID=1660183 RepID=A0ABV4I615_9ACTN